MQNEPIEVGNKINWNLYLDIQMESNYLFKHLGMHGFITLQIDTIYSTIYDNHQNPILKG